MNMAKLDTYDYFIMPGVIQITISGTNDPSLVDIFSEIDRSNGRIYVEGLFFLMVGYDIVTIGGRHYLNLKVTESN